MGAVTNSTIARLSHHSNFSRAKFRSLRTNCFQSSRRDKLLTNFRLLNDYTPEYSAAVFGWINTILKAVNVVVPMAFRDFTNILHLQFVIKYFLQNLAHDTGGLVV